MSDEPKPNRKQLMAALEPFARAYLVVRDVNDGRSEHSPARDLLPGIWPTWGDLKRAGETWKQAGGK